MVISKNVMEINRFENDKIKTITYRTACSCMEPDHDLVLEISFDKEYKDLSITFYKNIEYFTNFDESSIEKYLQEILYYLSENSYDKIYDIVDFFRSITSILVSFWKRLKDSKKVLFNGELKLEGSTLMNTSEDICNFINVLIEGLNFVDLEHKRELHTFDIKKDYWNVDSLSIKNLEKNRDINGVSSYGPEQKEKLPLKYPLVKKITIWDKIRLFLS